MKFVSHLEVTPVISGFYIDSFDFENQKKDVDVFHKLLNNLFKPSDELYFIMNGSTGCHLDEVKQEYLHNNSWFQANADLVEQPACLARLIFDKSKTKLITNTWNAFKNIKVFPRLEDLDWETFCSYSQTLFDSDPDSRKMFTFNFMNVILIKGSGGESLMINYKKDYPLPDIDKIFS